MSEEEVLAAPCDELDEEDCYDDDELEELEEVGELVSVSERMAPSTVASSRFRSVGGGGGGNSSVSSANTTATIVRLHHNHAQPRGSVILYDKTPAYGVMKVMGGQSGDG